MSVPEAVFAGLLKLTGLKQREVAYDLGVSRSTLAGWLSGYSPMPDEMVLKTHRLLSARLDLMQVRPDGRGARRASGDSRCPACSGADTDPSGLPEPDGP